jgi:hypothetical protein
MSALSLSLQSSGLSKLTLPSLSLSLSLSLQSYGLSKLVDDGFPNHPAIAGAIKLFAVAFMGTHFIACAYCGSSGRG